MEYVKILIGSIYYIFFLIYCHKLIPSIKPRRVLIFLSMLLFVAEYLLTSVSVIHRSNLLITGLLMIISLYFCTGMDWTQACHCGIMCVLYTCSFYDVAELLNTALSPYLPVWTDDHLSAFSFPAAILFYLVLRRCLAFDKKLKLFLQNIRQFKYIIIVEFIMAANLSVVGLGRPLLSNTSGLVIAMSTTVLTVASLVYTVLYYARSVQFFEARWIQKVLSERFERQIKHYDFYEKHIESFRIFVHDHKALMSLLKSLIKANENEKALRLIDSIDSEMHRKINQQKRFAKNVVLDAVLQDVANVCEVNKIRYSFNFPSPHLPASSQLNHIRIFNNVVNNAIEACIKVPEPDRFLELGNQDSDFWITLEARNSYTGKIVLNNQGRPVSTKADKHNHGLGIKSIYEVAEELGGFVVMEIDEDKNIFTIRIHLPKI